jgi:tape measure domain-containing protein
MADYSYAGLQVVVRAITEPMAASIRADALKAGDQAAAELEKALSRGIRAGMVAGVKEMTQTAKPLFSEAGATSGKVFTERFAASMSGVATAARKAAADAASASATAFEKGLVPRLAAAGTKAGEALASMSLAARKAAANAAISASLTFDQTLGPRLSAIAAKAGDAAGAVLGTRFAQGAKNAAIAAGTEFGTALTTALSEQMAKASAAGSAVLNSKIVAGAREAAVAAGTAFSTSLSAAMEKAASSAGAVWNSSMVAGARKTAAAVASEFGSTVRIALAVEMSKAADAVNTVMGSRLVTGAAKAAASAASRFGTTFRTVGAESMSLAAGAMSAVLNVDLVAGAKTAAVKVAGVMDTDLVTSMGIAGKRAAAAFSYSMQAGMQKVGAGVKGVAKQAGGAIKGVAEVAGAMGAGLLYYAVKAGVQYNVLYSQSLKAFTVILGSQKAADDMMTSIAKFAKTSPFPRQMFITATQTLLGFGFQAKQVIPTLSAIQDAVAVTRGGSTTAYMRIVQDLAKVQSSGKITARTLNELGTYGIDAAQLIGKGMDMTSAQVRHSITKGTLDSQQALGVLIEQMQIKFKGGAAGLKSTWTGSKQAIQAAMRDIGSAIVEPFISKKGGGLAIEWANKLGKVLWDIEPAVQPLVNALMKSLAPAIDLVNRGINWLLNQADKLKGANLAGATKAIEKFGGAFVAAGAAISVFTGAKLVTSLPIIGDAVKGMTDPFISLGKVLLNLADPVAWVIDAFILMMTFSKKFRDSVIGFGEGLAGFFRPIIGAVVIGVRLLAPPLKQVITYLGNELAPIINRLTPVLAPLGKAIGAYLVGDFRALAAVIKFLMPVIKLLIVILGDLINWTLDLLIPLVKVVGFLLIHFWPAINDVTHWISGAWDGLVKNTVKAWDSMTGALTGWWNTIRKPLTDTINWIGSLFSTAWGTLVTAAGSVGGDVLRTLKGGFETAWKDISGWVQHAIVGPIINAVKWFFGIGGSKPAASSGGGGAKAGAAAMAPQGGGGVATASAAPAGAAAGGAGGGVSGGGDSSPGLWGSIGDLFKGMVENVVTADPIHVAETIFGSMRDALGYIVVNGLVAVESLGKTALGALESIPGVSAAMTWVKDVALGGWNWVKGLFGHKGGASALSMVQRAAGFDGHPYVWGGGANPDSGFDCSSFVNMIAGMQGLPIPGGFHAPSPQHGPVTTNWLGFGGMKTVPYDAMMPGDLYINTGHMGIVTGKGMGFAARSTETGTGPQSVPRGLYTIRRFLGAGGGVAGSADILADALAGLLSQSAGVMPTVISGDATTNLLTIARYMAANGWSAAGAAGVAGNIYRESLGDPLSFGSGGRGLIGWTPPSTLPNSAFIPGQASLSLSRQLPLVNQFFHANMGRYIALANAQSDAGRAALVIMNMGERPAGSSQSDPFFPGVSTSAGSQRAAMARQIFEFLKQSATVKMATGGIISEPVAGIGASGARYLMGEAGAEGVVPLGGSSLQTYLKRLLELMARSVGRPHPLGRVVINEPLHVAVASVSPTAAKTVAKENVAAAVAAAGTTSITPGGVTVLTDVPVGKPGAKSAASAAAHAAKVAADNARKLAKAEAEDAKALAAVKAANATRLAKAVAENTKLLDNAEARNATRLAKAKALNAAHLAADAVRNATRLGKAVAEDAKQAARTAAREVARTAASDAARLAKAEARLAKDPTATNAQKAAAKAAAENAKTTAATAARAATRLAKAVALNAAEAARQAARNSLRLHNAAVENAKQLARTAQSNATRLAKAEARDSTGLTKTKEANRKRLAKAMAEDAKMLAATEARNAARLAKAQGEILKTGVGTSVADAVAAATMTPAQLAVYNNKKKGIFPLGDVVVRAPVNYSTNLAINRRRGRLPTGAPIIAESTAARARLTPQAADAAAFSRKIGAVVINVYPQKGQSEAEIAAAVSRALNWAAQGGAK